LTRPHAILRTADQWARCAHDATTLDAEGGGVLLAWTDPAAAAAAGAAPAAAGLAFDSACRLYRSVPGEGRVERRRWRPRSRLEPARGPEPAPLDLLGGGGRVRAGDFVLGEPAGGRLADPRALAIDTDDRLYVAETAARRILVYDIWSGRLLRRIGLRGAPLDLAVRDRGVVVLTRDPAALLQLEARGGPRPGGALPPLSALQPRRLAVSPDGALVLLARDTGGGARVVPLAEHDAAFDVPGAGDIEHDGDGAIVLARGPGEDFRRFRRDAEGYVEDLPLGAGRYDGLGIVRTPDGRIAYWSDAGLRTATRARVRYHRMGRVTTYRLDAGEPQVEWGRLSVDACVPHGTEVLVHTATADEQGDEDTIARNPPANAVSLVVRRPDLSPPLPPVSLAAAEVAGRVHRRPAPEQPWVRAADAFATYEAPVLAPPGRFLWITLELRGTGRSTPRVRALRAERPGHDLLRRLPRAFSRDPDAASFTRRYLALLEGVLDDLDGRARQRHLLLDPRTAPADALPWLAGFLGLVLDDRWPEPRRRTLIGLAPYLFRLRGTLPGLKAFLDASLDTSVMIVEHWRLRGLGAPLAGAGGGSFAGSVVGENAWVGGAVGGIEGEPLAGTAADAFAAHTHRFSVVVPAVLSEEETAAVRHVLDVHRPAHTIVEVCTVGAGMRVGRGLHVGLLSLIGPTGGWDTVRLGAAALGRGSVVGRPEPGTQPGLSGVGVDTRVG
jgi:phage tail-like protein